MIWATGSSQSCFCWLYRAAPSLAAKNIINLISVLTIWWCPCVESSLVLLEEGVCHDQCVQFCQPLSCFILYSKAKLAFTPGVFWLPAFASQSLLLKRTFFFVCVLVLKVLQVFTDPFSFFGISYWGIDLDDWYWIVCLGNKLPKSFCHFWDCTQVLYFGFYYWLWELLHFF